MIHRTAVICSLAVLGALVACSDGSSTAGSAGGSTTGARSHGYATAKAVVEQLKSHGITCSSEEDASGQLFTRDGWTCHTSSDGPDVSAYLFSNKGNRDQWLKVAKGFGGNYVVGDTWVVDTDTPALQTQVQTILGGSTQ
jgi:hypothetical protein